MSRLRRGSAGLVLVAAALVGCGTRTAADTGARAAAEGYFGALIRRDWPGAYAALHAESRARLRPEEFARLARQYRDGLGFEPTGVAVRFCEEHGEEAAAHVVLTGPAKHGRHRDAATLRGGAGGWGVVLPPNFGRAHGP